MTDCCYFAHGLLTKRTFPLHCNCAHSLSLSLSLFSLPPSLFISFQGQVVFPQVLHFFYKANSLVPAQYTSPIFTAPFLDASSQKRILRKFQRLHQRIHSSQEEHPGGSAHRVSAARLCMRYIIYARAHV